MNKKSRINPIVKILIAAAIAIGLTVGILMMMGGRYTTLADGSKFIGEYENGQPVKGVIHFNNGEIGNLDYYEKTITYDNGDLYVGDIEGGLPNGYGVKTHANTGDVYEGEFSDNEISGEGVYKYSNGDYFKGTFENEQKTGEGELIYANGNSYKGSYENDVRSGYGVFTWASGAKYTGYFSNDLKNGKGVMVYESGDVFEGSFKDDMRDGDNCVYSWANGERYNGPFRNNLMDTRLVDENGKFIVDENGEYVHGAKAIYTFTTDRTYTGHFENGKAVGISIG